MADPKSIAGELGLIDPDVQASWLQRYAPQQGQKIVLPSRLGFNPSTLPSSAPVDTLAPRNAAEADAIARISGQVPQGAPPPAPPPRMFAEGAQEPRRGDWSGHNATVDQNEAARNRRHLEGATFADGSGGAAPPAAPVGGGMTLVSKGGRTPSSWTTQTQEGIQLSDETKNKAHEAEGARLNAAAAGRDAGILEAHRDLAYLTEHERFQDARQRQYEDRAVRQQKSYEGELAKLRDMTSKVQNDQIEPSLYFQKRGAAGFFATAIGVMAGAVGSAMTGRPNAGIAALREGIAQEIDAQKSNAQLRRGKLEDQRSLLGQMAKTFGDERVAEEAAWIAYLEKAKTRLAQQAAKTTDDRVRARYLDAVSQVKEEIAGRAEKWDVLAKNRVVRMEHEVNAPPVYAGAGGGGGTEGLTHKEEEYASGLSDALVKSGIPGAREDLSRLLSVIPGEGEVPGVGGVHGAASQMGGTVEKLDNAAYNFFGSTQGQEIRQAAAVLFNRQLKDESGAAVSDQELERQKAAFYGARDARSARAALSAYGNRLNALESTVRSRANPKINAVQRQRQSSEEQRLAPKKKFSGPQEPK